MIVFWENKEIAAVATGYSRPCKNGKTGRMVQAWILSKTVHPVAAIALGTDQQVCGNCPRRPSLGGDCYVMPPPLLSLWRGLRAAPRGLPDLRGRPVRLGSYGDPGAVPLTAWRRLLRRTSGWTGYTHQWRRLRPAWAELLMASLDHPEEVPEAERRGWRWFLAHPQGHPSAVLCPAGKRLPSGRKVTCESCLLCRGTSLQAKSVWIAPHGTRSRSKFLKEQRLERERRELRQRPMLFV